MARQRLIRNASNTAWETRGGLPTGSGEVPPDQVEGHLAPLSVATMKAVRQQVHGPSSIWNLPLASKSSATQTVSTELSDINGQSLAFNLAQQAFYNNTTPTDGVLGYFSPGFGTSMNIDAYSMPVYVVPSDQPLSQPLWWRQWDQAWTRVGRGVANDLEGQFLAVPLPDLNLCKSGTNGFTFRRAASAGATTVYIQDQGYGTYSWGGANFTVTSCTATSNAGEWAITITPGLAAGASVGQKTARPKQMESNGDDKSLIIQQIKPDGSMPLWEFWGFRPDLNAPGGYSFAYGGYVADTRNWNGIFPHTWGMRAVSMSAVGGAVTLDDIQRGKINHALNIAIVVSGTVNGRSWDAPATRWDGANVTLVAGVSDAGNPGRHRVPVGGYYRLPVSGWSNAQIASFVTANKSGVTDQAFAEMILRAIRDYGIYITDSSGSVSFYGEGVQSVGTPYSPYTQADMNAVGDDWYDWYRMPFWSSLVKLVPNATST